MQGPCKNLVGAYISRSRLERGLSVALFRRPSLAQKYDEEFTNFVKPGLLSFKFLLPGPQSIEVNNILTVIKRNSTYGFYKRLHQKLR